MDTTNNKDRPKAAGPLDAVATEHIMERLREALTLAETGLPDNLERFRELLEEAADQTDSWVLTRITDRFGDVDQPTSRIECSLLARPGGEPLDEFLLIPFGEVRVERAVSGGDFVFTSKHAESAQNWFARMGRKLAIDYEHQSFDRCNARPDGLRPAAGWIGRLEVRDDGLWACDVNWTERARELLRTGEYRYFSPVIYWADEDYSDVAALGPVALTNDPAMRGVQPLAASRREPDDLRLQTGATDDRPEACPTEEDDGEALLRAELDALNEEIEVLQKQLAAQEADAFVQEGIRLGKILDSTSMDWREDYLRDSERTHARLKRAPVILTPGRVIDVNQRWEAKRGGVLAARNKTSVEAARHGVEAEDLEAYERALAAGRIQHFGVT